MQVKQEILENNFETSDLAQNSKLAMTVALISWSMLFATLLLGYFIYRSSQTTWPPLGVEPISLLLPNLSLFFVVISSVCYWMAIKSFKKAQMTTMRYFLTSCLFFGLAYMFTQIQFWGVLNSMNLFSSSNIFGSILHGFTWIHAGHMVLAMLALITVLMVSWNENRAKNSFLLIYNVGVFWHFLTVIWFVLYLILFII